MGYCRSRTKSKNVVNAVVPAVYVDTSELPTLYPLAGRNTLPSVI